MGDEKLTCDACGGSEFEAVVRHGSYTLRCSACHSIGPSTSWMAVGLNIIERLTVFKEGRESHFIFEGRGTDIWQAVLKLAADGTALILKAENENGA
jgi:hypothetical protein